MKTELLEGKIGFFGGKKDTWGWEEKFSLIFVWVIDKKFPSTPIFNPYPNKQINILNLPLLLFHFTFTFSHS
jgi:hypothetical protein